MEDKEINIHQAVLEKAEDIANNIRKEFGHQCDGYSKTEFYRFEGDKYMIAVSAFWNPDSFFEYIVDGVDNGYKEQGAITNF